MRTSRPLFRQIFLKKMYKSYIFWFQDGFGSLTGLGGRSFSSKKSAIANRKKDFYINRPPENEGIE
jgi:hypothetical protein